MSSSQESLRAERAAIRLRLERARSPETQCEDTELTEAANKSLAEFAQNLLNAHLRDLDSELRRICSDPDLLQPRCCAPTAPVPAPTPPSPSQYRLSPTPSPTPPSEITEGTSVPSDRGLTPATPLSPPAPTTPPPPNQSKRKRERDPCEPDEPDELVKRRRTSGRGVARGPRRLRQRRGSSDSKETTAKDKMDKSAVNACVVDHT